MDVPVKRESQKEDPLCRNLIDSCTAEEVSIHLGGNYKQLIELRNKLRDWLIRQPHLPQDVSDKTLENFILKAKLSSERAEQTIDAYFTVRTLMPELFGNRDPRSPDFTQLRKTVHCVCLPNLTPERHRVIIIKWIADTNFKSLFWTLGRYAFMICDVLLLECMNFGDIIIYDLANIPFEIMTHMTPSIIKKMCFASINAYGTRLKGLHFVNAPSYMGRLVSITKSCFKPKLAERVHVHTTNETMYKLLPKSMLPTDYGGDGYSLERLSEAWHHKLLEWRDWFIEQENVIVDENLRPGPMIDSDEMFGTMGSFRALEFD